MAPRKKPAKPARRKPGTGAIRFKRGRERPYEAGFKLSNGETRYEYFSTAEEAAAHLDQLVAERDNAEAPRNIAKGSQSVIQFLTAWLQIKAAHVSAKTLQDYKYQCDLAAGEIGRYRIDQVDLMMADTMLATFARQGYKNVAQMRMVLKQAFDYAEENNYIKKNPFRKSTAPATKHKKRVVLNERQRAALLEAAAALEDAALPLAPLWHLYSRLAFRRGEGLGLRWADIDFDAATITVAQQRTTVGSQTITKEAPKGGEDKVRIIPVPLDLLDMLHAHQKAQIKRAAADPEWQLTGLVFVGEHGRPPAAYTVNRRLDKLIEHAGLPRDLVPHGLRHTALTLLALAGVPANVRKALSGHSTAKMDEHYTSHAALEDVRRALGG
jgi:integrase